MRLWSGILALTTALLVSGCGFSPAFGTNSRAEDLRNQVVVSTPSSRIGFNLRAALQDRFGLVDEGRYALDVVVDQERTVAAVSEDGDTTRFDLTGRANWTLMEMGQAVGQGTATSFSSYSATGSTVAAQSAADDAEVRLAAKIAELIVADLILLTVP